MKSTVYTDFIKPVLVLTLICVVVSAALAFTYNFTAPVIADNQQREAEAARIELLPAAVSFEQIPCDIENIESIYKDSGGGGFVITANAKGYGGDVTVRIGLDSEGNIIGINAVGEGETSGIGSNALESEYLDRFVTSADSAGVDEISGATYSSRAVKQAVKLALEAFQAVEVNA